MKLLTETVLLLSLLASASAQTNQSGAASAFGTQRSQASKITRSGSQPAERGPAENFTGSVRVDSRFQATEPGRASGARVTFDPGARTAWHSHPLGQTLIVTAGVGRVQRWGDPVHEIRQGDVVWIPPGQNHWHGASTYAGMLHIAIVELLNGKSTYWMEKVSDAQYAAQIQAQRTTSVGQPGQAGPAPQMMRDLAPKLADLTNNVLFGDIWERPGLSKRDRSPAVVAALIAMNRPDQPLPHLAWRMKSSRKMRFRGTSRSREKGEPKTATRDSRTLW